MAILKAKQNNNYPAPKNILLGCWNVHGLFSLDGSKLNDSELLHNIEQVDICALLETWMSPEHNQHLFELQGYYIYNKLCKKRTKGRGSGGISLCIKKEIKKGVKIMDVLNGNCIWLKMDKNFFGNEADIFIGVWYIPPNINEDWCEGMEELICKYKDKGEVILMGDMNARIGTCNECILYDNNDNVEVPENYVHDEMMKRVSSDIKVNSYGRKLLKMCTSLQMRVLNGRTLGDLNGGFTCWQWNGRSVVDYIIVQSDKQKSVKWFKVLAPSHISDHSMICCSYQMDGRKNITKDRTNTAVFPDRYVWQKDSETKFREGLLKNNNKINRIQRNTYQTRDSSIDRMCKDITHVYIDTAQISLKKKKKIKKKYKQHKWYDKSCSDLKNMVISAGKLLAKYNRDPQVCGNYIKLKNQYKKLVKKKKHSFNEVLFEQIAKFENNNPTEFWKLINNIKDTKSTTEGIDIQIWKDFFSKLHNPKEGKSKFTEEISKKLEELLNSNQANVILDKSISEQEIWNAAKKMKNKKATGLDGISNEMVKTSLSHMSKVLCNFFNKILIAQVFPHEWAISYIHPIHKKGPKDNPDNHRGISISSCLGKLFTLILSNRLTAFLEEEGIIPLEQIGFKAKHRTADHILVLKALIDEMKRKGRPLFACFVDLKKAYDSIWHNGLLYKLCKYKVGSTFINIIQNMYTKMKSCVKIDSWLSEFFPVNVGTRQGCNLSPTLFNLYLADLPLYMKQHNCKPVLIGDTEINMLMYADDLVVLSYKECDLQHSLGALEEYCQKWKLQINVQKTKIMSFNKRNDSKFKYKIYNTEIEKVKQFCYLGVIFTPSGKVTATVKRLANKASKAYYMYRNFFNHYNGTKVNVLLKLFDSLCSPILLYCSEVWGTYHKLNSITESDIQNDLRDLSKVYEQVHIKCCKQILGVTKNATNILCLNELGRLPMIYNVLKRMIKYYHNLVTQDGEKHLTTKLLNTNTQYPIPIQNKIKILGNYFGIGLEQLKTKEKVGQLLDKLKHTMTKDMETQLKEKSTVSSRVRLYTLIKKNFGRANYLDFIKDAELRRLMTKARISNHCWPVETLRYGSYNIPYQERRCHLCLNKIGNEFHYMMACSNEKLVMERNVLRAMINRLCPDFGKLSMESQFLYLMSGNDEQITVYTSNYLKNIQSVVK